MDRYTAAAVRRGIEAAALAGIPQVLLPQLEQRLLGLPAGSADIGPRLIRRVGARLGRRVSEDVEWLGASAFHFGYAAFWGALYALAYERRPVHPALGGAVLGAVVWSVAFPRWGGAVLTGTEPPPNRRSWRETVLLATAAFGFGLGTALGYGRGPRGSDFCPPALVRARRTAS